MENGVKVQVHGSGPDQKIKKKNYFPMTSHFIIFAWFWSSKTAILNKVF